MSKISCLRISIAYHLNLLADHGRVDHQAACALDTQNGIPSRSEEAAQRLFWQHDLSFDLKVCAHRGNSYFGLAAPDRDRVLALRHDDVPEIGDHAKVARVQL